MVSSTCCVNIQRALIRQKWMLKYQSKLDLSSHTPIWTVAQSLNFWQSSSSQSKATLTLNSSLTCRDARSTALQTRTSWCSSSVQGHCLPNMSGIMSSSARWTSSTQDTWSVPRVQDNQTLKKQTKWNSTTTSLTYCQMRRCTVTTGSNKLMKRSVTSSINPRWPSILYIQT